MRCPSCGAENPDRHRFCGSCGEFLQQPRQAQKVWVSIRRETVQGKERGMSSFLRSMLTIPGAILTAVIGAIALTLFVGMAIPASQRMVAPLVCPKGYREAVIVTESRVNYPGSTTTRSEFYCIDGNNKAFYVDLFTVLVYMAGGFFIALLLVLGLAAIASKSRKQAVRPGEL
ncbi:MAG: zinc-ribbon domain-containing protein [Deltaproteobacteria bacterium]|nr:MAG: zinc-ribbon domain-containing protein [Deltaproteobacteria bacterium]